MEADRLQQKTEMLRTLLPDRSGWQDGSGCGFDVSVSCVQHNRDPKPKGQASNVDLIGSAGE